MNNRATRRRLLLALKNTQAWAVRERAEYRHHFLVLWEPDVNGFKPWPLEPQLYLEIINDLQAGWQVLGLASLGATSSESAEFALTRLDDEECSGGWWALATLRGVALNLLAVFTGRARPEQLTTVHACDHALRGALYVHVRNGGAVVNAAPAGTA